VNEFADSTEPECTVDSDCDDSDPDTVDSCYRAGTAGAHCLNEYSPQTPDAPSGPSASDFSVEFVSELPDSAERASSFDLVVRILDSDGNPVSDAIVSVVDSNDNSIQFSALQDGKYEASMPIPPSFPLGENAFNVSVERDSSTGESSFDLNVSSAEIEVELVSPVSSKHIVGSSVDFVVRLSYSNGIAVDDANVFAFTQDGNMVFVSDGNGLYSLSFPLNSLGYLDFNILAADLYGNSGLEEVSIEVLTLEGYAWLVFGLLLFVLVLLIVLMLILLFYMRFKHILVLERKNLKYKLMKKKAQALISSVSGQKKKDLESRAAYLDKLIRENDKSIAFMKKRSLLTLGDIPMDLYFGLKSLQHSFASIPRVLFSARSKIADREASKIDAEVADLNEMIRLLENDFYKQRISDGQFKKALFDYRKKIHLLEIKKKKLG